MTFPLTLDIRVDNSDSAALAVHDILTQLEGELDRRKSEHAELTQRVEFDRMALVDLIEEALTPYLQKITLALGAFRRKYAKLDCGVVQADQLEHMHLRFGVSNIEIQHSSVEATCGPLLFVDGSWRVCRILSFVEIEIREKTTRVVLFADNDRVRTAAQAVKRAEAAAATYHQTEIAPLEARIKDRARIEQTVRAELTRKLLGHDAAKALGRSLSDVTTSLTARLLEDTPCE